MANERGGDDARVSSTAPVRWRGDEHRLQVQAANEAGLRGTDVEVDLYTRGFSEGMILEDEFDGAIVARGRTVLKDFELVKVLRPVLQYLGVPRDAIKLRVFDGSFELRVAKHAAEASRPSLDAGKTALQVWIGFGLLGLAAMQFLPSFVAAFIWSAGLLLGGWQLRRGLVTGRAMLSARLAVALGMLAHEEKLILPPADPGGV